MWKKLDRKKRSGWRLVGMSVFFVVGCGLAVAGILPPWTIRGLLPAALCTGAIGWIALLDPEQGGT